MKLMTIDATEDLTISIKERHVRKAKCRDKNACVIAQALKDGLPMVSEVEVGPSITKVTIDRFECRFRTPFALRRALNHYDDTGEWILSVGDYVLRAPTGADKIGGRVEAPRGKGGGRPARPVRRLPSRRTSRPKKGL